MYSYIYVYIYICILYIYMHTHVYLYLYIYMYVHMYTHIYIYSQISNLSWSTFLCKLGASQLQSSQDGDHLKPMIIQASD